MKPKLSACMISIAVVIRMLGAQSLFESSQTISPADSTQSRPSAAATNSLEWNGYVKGSLFGGRNNLQEAEFQAATAEVSLKLRGKSGSWGSMYADMRLKSGLERTSTFFTPHLREAWLSITPGIFDIRLGRQIFAWGRADAINPTDNITPHDQTVLSSQFDDTRLGNEILSASATLSALRIEAIWIPFFRPDSLPLHGAALPSSVTMGAPRYPRAHPVNSSYALRLDLALPSVDGSLSWFDGYATLPGFTGLLSETGLAITPRAYRIHAPGLDFSTTLGTVGIRGEAAMKFPALNHETRAHIPNPYAAYVLGMDRTFGEWTALLQYAGQYTFNFEKQVTPRLTDPFNPMAQMLYAAELADHELERINRLMTGTAHRMSHSLLASITWSTLYETLQFDLSGMYAFTTQDWLINPACAYQVSDALTCRLGGRYLDGPKDGLHDLVSNLLSHVYLEMIYSF